MAGFYFFQKCLLIAMGPTVYHCKRLLQSLYRHQDIRPRLSSGGSVPDPTADLDSFLASSAVGPRNPLRGLGQVSTATEADREVGTALT